MYQTRKLFLGEMIVSDAPLKVDFLGATSARKFLPGTARPTSFAASQTHRMLTELRLEEASGGRFLGTSVCLHIGIPHTQGAEGRRPERSRRGRNLPARLPRHLAGTLRRNTSWKHLLEGPERGRRLGSDPWQLQPGRTPPRGGVGGGSRPGGVSGEGGSVDGVREGGEWRGPSHRDDVGPSDGAAGGKGRARGGCGEGGEAWGNSGPGGGARGRDGGQAGGGGGAAERCPCEEGMGLDLCQGGPLSGV